MIKKEGREEEDCLSQVKKKMQKKQSTKFRVYSL